MEVIVGTSKELHTHTRPFTSRELVLCSTTGKLRRGDGTSMWWELERIPSDLQVELNVRVVAKSNVTIATALNNGDSLSGVTLATGDKVLLAGQTDSSTNGIYTVGTTPARTTGYTTFPSMAGLLVKVDEGTYAGQLYLCAGYGADEPIGSTLKWDRVDLPYLDLDQSAPLDVLPAITPLLGTDKLLVQRADGSLGTVTAAVLKTYTTS